MEKSESDHKADERGLFLFLNKKQQREKGPKQDIRENGKP